MSDIKISLIGSAFRTNNWLKIYDSVKKNKIGFEIVYVGPNKPDFQLPDNFRFIQSDVKPVQCIEIAARAIIILFGLMNWKKKVFRKVTGFGLTCFDLINEKEIL